MKTKCPLCLLELNEEEKLSRHCFDHPDSKESFRCTEDNLHDKLYCPEQGCECNGMIGVRSVFLRHETCAAKNPFYDKNGIVRIPGGVDSEAGCYTRPDGEEIHFTHWEIGMLRYVPAEPEMWFPAILLRSTLKYRNGKRMGVRVELSGDRGVGKTVLAMQAMDKQGYEPLLSKDRSVKVRGFIYSRGKPETRPEMSPLLAALCLRALHRDNEDNLFRLASHQHGTGDLKAVFIKPAPEQRDETGLVDGPGRTAWEKIRYYIFDPLMDMLLNRGTAAGQYASDDAWYTVSFYDTSGEDAQMQSFELHGVESGVDKIAVLINANDIFSTEGGPSFSIANRKLLSAERKGSGNYCLVVTRMDEVTTRLSSLDRLEVSRLVNTFDTSENVRKRSHELLLSWLSEHSPDNDLNKRELRDYLESHNIPVFLVWTENLMNNGRDGDQPESHGLSHLICWCLGINWKTINHKARQ